MSLAHGFVKMVIRNVARSPQIIYAVQMDVALVRALLTVKWLSVVLDVDLTTVALPLAAAGLPRKEIVVNLVQPASSASQDFVIGIHAQAE